MTITTVQALVTLTANELRNRIEALVTEQAASRPDIAKLVQTPDEPALTSIVTVAPDPRDARTLPRRPCSIGRAGVSRLKRRHRPCKP